MSWNTIYIQYIIKLRIILSSPTPIICSWLNSRHHAHDLHFTGTPRIITNYQVQHFAPFIPHLRKILRKSRIPNHSQCTTRQLDNNRQLRCPTTQISGIQCWTLARRSWIWSYSNKWQRMTDSIGPGIDLRRDHLFIAVCVGSPLYVNDMLAQTSSCNWVSTTPKDISQHFCQWVFCLC